MSSIITGILNSTIGLLWNKTRDWAAVKLQHGDVTDAQIREIVVRELNDIKTKLDALSRKDLLSSYSFLREGVELLNVCLDRSTHSTQDDQGESSTMSSDVASAILNEVLEMTRAVEKLNIKSCSEYKSARKRFEDARKEATKAFCNEALKIEDRIFAAKLRVVSEILENLESPNTAITGCLSFLRDLHSLPAIREIFSVYLNGGVKSLLGKEERVANVKSVMLINYVLFQFTFKFSSKAADRVHWQAGIIELADRSFNPVLEWEKVSSRKSMGGELGEAPNVLVLDEEIYPRLSTLNSHGEIIVRHSHDEIRIISRTGKTKLVKLPEPRKGEHTEREIKALAVDSCDTVYVVSCRRTDLAIFVTYVLSVLDAGYNVKHVGPLLEEKYYALVLIALSRNNDIIMIKRDDSLVYVFDNSGKLRHKFVRDSDYLFYLSISDKNEIITPSKDGKAVNLYTKEGSLASTIKLPKGHLFKGVAFHRVIGRMIALTCVEERDSSFRCFLLYYSEVGELEFETFFCVVSQGIYSLQFPVIISHPAGPAAVVRGKNITFI